MAKSDKTHAGRHKAVWIHLDIPYEGDALSMAGHLGYRENGDGAVRVISLEGKDVPQVIGALLTEARKLEVAWGSDVVLALPLDDRMMLSHLVLEEAQKRGFQFHREIPDEHRPEPGALWKTRPRLKELPADEARLAVEREIVGGNEASGEREFPQALSRYLGALERSVALFGWANVRTAVIVRMMCQVYRATGNRANERTAARLLADMAAGLKSLKGRPEALEDGNYVEFVGRIAEEAEALDLQDLRNFFNRHIGRGDGADDVEEDAEAFVKRAQALAESVLAKSGDRVTESEGEVAPADLKPVGEWFKVTHDDRAISIAADPPGMKSWTASIPWSTVEKICYKNEDFTGSDHIYLFVKDREASFVIPTEGSGGRDLWSHILDKGIIPPEICLKISMAPTGTLTCYDLRTGEVIVERDQSGDIDAFLG